jgi:hypothetical protein
MMATRSIIRRAAAGLAVGAALAGCATIHGTYVVTAQDAAGKPLASNVRLTAKGSRIYVARNGLCAAFPKSVVTIRDVATGRELKGESPYTCP